MTHSSTPFIISTIIIAGLYILGVISITYGFNFIIQNPEIKELDILRDFYSVLNNNVSISLINGFLTGIVAMLVFLYQRRINRKDKIHDLLTILSVEIELIMTVARQTDYRSNNIILKPDHGKSYDGFVNSGLLGYFSKDFQKQLRDFYSQLGKEVDNHFIKFVPRIQEDIDNLMVENEMKFIGIYW